MQLIHQIFRGLCLLRRTIKKEVHVLELEIVGDRTAVIGRRHFGARVSRKPH